MKHVVIVAPFVTFPGEPGENRFISIARRLSRFYRVSLITSQFCHSTKSQRTSIPELDGIEVVLLDEPGYRNNVGISRVISHASFCRNLSRWLSSNSSFDLAYSAFPLIKSNLILARHLRDTGTPLIIDVQDIWPEAIAGPLPYLSGSLGQVFLTPLRYQAVRVLRAADALVAVSHTYLNHADINGLPENRKAMAFIGAERLNFVPYENFQNICRPLRAVYLGSFAGSYDLETLVYASKLTQNVRIELIGGGPHESYLRSLAKKINAPVMFHGSMPFKKTMETLQGAHIAINAIRETALQSITNKLSDYFCTGLPILSSQQQPEVISLLEQGGGLTYKPGDAAGLAKLLDHLSQRPEKLLKMSRVNRALAKEKFHRETSYSVIDDLVERVLAAPN